TIVDIVTKTPFVPETFLNLRLVDRNLNAVLKNYERAICKAIAAEQFPHVASDFPGIAPLCHRQLHSAVSRGGPEDLSGWPEYSAADHVEYASAYYSGVGGETTRPSFAWLAEVYQRYDTLEQLERLAARCGIQRLPLLTVAFKLLYRLTDDGNGMPPMTPQKLTHGLTRKNVAGNFEVRGTLPVGYWALKDWRETILALPLMVVKGLSSHEGVI
ncbi:hypothetical protein LTR04_001600, partial [Oleoguttula sp. CCFEE 6159]